MEASPNGIVVTGANGQLGRALLSELARRSHPHVRALVRSERAKATIEAMGLEPAPEIAIVDYTSPKEMEAVLTGMSCVVHLVGIIKETSEARYAEAHEQTCHALALAADRANIERIVYLSILGSKTNAENDCLASKGRAEALLLDDRVPATVIRVPMVLGGDDPASDSLRRQAQSEKLRLIDGGRTLQQPIDARDVVKAILAACSAAPGQDLCLDAGGPESVSHRELVFRAARLWNNEPKIRSIPGGLARFVVRILGRVHPRPPITLAMFDILQHDDRVDPSEFTGILGIQLIPLTQTLADHVGPTSAGSKTTEPGRARQEPAGTTHVEAKSEVQA